jgi:hypothetical protein
MISVYGKPHPYIKNTSLTYIVQEVSLFLCPVFGIQSSFAASLFH